MQHSNGGKPLLRHLILSSIKLPAIFFILGILLRFIANLDDLFGFKTWVKALNVLESIGTIFLLFGVVAFIYRFCVLICTHFEHIYNQRNQHTLNLALKSLRKGLKIIYVFVSLNIIVTSLASDQIYFAFLNKLIYVVILLTIAWVALEIVSTLESVISHYVLKNKPQNHIKAKDIYTKTQIIKNILSVMIVFLTIIAILMSFENVKNLGISLLASAGFLTAIVGLAAQKSLTSVFAGLQIAFSERIKIGDYIVIEGEQGAIEQITLTYVTIKISDNRRLILPIGYFIDKSFENWSRDGDKLKGDVYFYATPEVSLDHIREELNAILKGSAHWDQRTAEVQISKFKDYTVEVCIKISAKNPDKLGKLRAELREKILVFLRDNHPNYLPDPKNQPHV